MIKHIVQKIKQQSTKARRTGADDKKTPIKSEDKYSYFESKWKFDEDGFVHFKSEETSDLILGLAELLCQIVDGTVLEPYYDSQKHKRYYKHPTHDINGFVFLGSKYILGQCPDKPNGLILTRVCLGESVKIANFNLLRYVQFRHYVPSINIMLLAYHICESIVEFLMIAADEEASFDTCHETVKEYSIDTEKDVFFVYHSVSQNYYGFSPLDGKWDAHDILNTIEKHAAEEGTTIKLDWNNRRYLALGEETEVIPVVPVVPMNENGGGSYSPIAFLSYNLARQVSSVM